MTAAPRRIITGTVEGRSQIVSVDQGGGFLATGAGGGIHEIWSSTAQAPMGDTAGSEAPPAFAPGPDGSSCRLVRIPPDAERWSDPEAAARAAAAIGQERPAHWMARHPGMHVTSSLDYVLVLEGEVVAVMEDGEIALAPGNVLVQRATPHAWKNPGKVAALLFVTMIGLNAPVPA
ncbi:cupin domain-containing protein [Devosia ginsengisoli]|uniref:Cupin domain-containing protein n=1 Tax=Devosia ginsengisoli TaxID=400770 RepID=A0A5B8LYI3_9HYPH|nr:cupin domain-containing protein [Devosia ginsengisoli]QDZ12881.1 cupin domain-containing protein [Devosia ginsengisoli]